MIKISKPIKNMKVITDKEYETTEDKIDIDEEPRDPNIRCVNCED